MDAYANIDRAAHESAYGHNLRPTPSVAQQDAGNYKKGRASVAGIPVVIENPRGSLREWRAADGTSGANLMKFHYGYIDGVTGADGDELDCYVGPHPESPTAYVINQNVRGAFDEHKVMLGFPDQRMAEAGYLSNFDAGWPGLGSCVPCSIGQLRRWMASGDLSKPLTKDQLPHEERNPMQKVLWDSANQPRGKTLAQVLYDVRAHDGSDGLIFDPVCMADVMADADGIVTFDAMVTPYAKLPQRMAILQKVMNRKGGDLSVLAVQISEPFTQKGTTNVAAVFELSDGQTITIFFHNPDVTPKKIMAGDEVVSWKWMLNKKDVTIVVAPERGRDLNVQNVAARVMTLAARNSARFAQTNANRAARMENIASLQKQHADGEATLAGLQQEIAELEVRVEAHKNTPVIADPAPAAAVEPGKTIAQAAIDNQDAATLDAIQARLDAQLDALSLDDLRRMASYEPTFIKRGDKMPDYDLRDALKQQHPDDIQTSLDYLTKYQESIAADQAAAAAAAAAQPDLPLEPVAPVAKGDISYRQVDELFTAFYPNTDAGVNAWNVINAADPSQSGTGKVLNTQADSVIAQLRAAGYSVYKSKDDPSLSTDDLLAALTGDDAEGANAAGPDGVTVEQPEAVAEPGPTPLALPDPAQEGEPVLKAAGFKNISGNVWLRMIALDGGKSFRININVADNGYNLTKSITMPGITGASEKVGVFDTAEAAVAAAQAEFDAVIADFKERIKSALPGADVLEANGFVHAADNVWTRSQANNDGVKLALSAFIQPDGTFALRKGIIGLTDTGDVEDVGTYATPGELVDAANDAIEAFLSPADPVPEFDPTTPDGYAAVMANPDMQLRYQDALDAFFQGRIVAVRDALLNLGWQSRDPLDARLYQDDSEIQPTFVKVGAGSNVVGYAMNGIADDLTRTSEQFAADVSAAALVESAARAAAEPPHKSEQIIAALCRSFGWTPGDSPSVAQKNVGGADTQGVLNPEGDRIVFAQFDESGRYLSLVSGFETVFDVDTRDGDVDAIASEFDARVTARVATVSDPTATALATAPSLDDLIAQAAALGTQAFADGKESTPALNADLTPLIASAGDNAAAVIKAYADAWHAANAAAPVEGATDDTTPAGATQEQAVTAMKTLRPFMSTSQMRAISDAMRGEEKQAFFDKVVEMAAIIASMPVSYETDGQGNDAVARLHYFRGGSDWYITEKDRDGSGADQAFGYAILNGDREMAELGYISIAELVSAGVELDLYWTPQTIGQIRKVSDDTTSAAETAANVFDPTSATNGLPASETLGGAQMLAEEAGGMVIRDVQTGLAIDDFSGIAYDTDNRRFVLTEIVDGSRTYTALAARAYDEAVEEVAALKAANAAPELTVPGADITDADNNVTRVYQPDSVTPLSDETMQKYVAIAADSIEKLRRIDVYRVLDALPADNPDGVTRAALATWIATKRPDLAPEIAAVMAEEWPGDGWTAPTAATTTDPAVTVTDPLPEGGTVVPPVVPAENGNRTADLDFLKAVAAQSIDMMADGVAERIEATLGVYPGDSEIEAAVRAAVTAYTDYMTKAIGA